MRRARRAIEATQFRTPRLPRGSDALLLAPRASRAMQTLLTTRFAPPALAATSQAKMSERAPQDRVMLPEIRAPEDERHARLLERMRARLPSHRSTSRSTSRDAMQVLRACN